MKDINHLSCIVKYKLIHEVIDLCVIQYTLKTFLKMISLYSGDVMSSGWNAGMSQNGAVDIS